MSKVVAVIDIGSNSARMAIFRRTSRFGFSLVFETKSKVRISEGCYEHNGILQDKPIERALNAIRDFHLIAKEYKARKLFCVATSAVRDAPNRQKFISLIKKETTIQVKVIDGEKEAFFGAVACLNLLHKKSGITIDIGGGSTECAIIKDGRLCELISLNLGTIRLKELFFDTKIDIKNAIAFIQKEFSRIPPNFKSDVVFGIGGTIRALSKLIMKKEEYPITTIHGYEFCVERYLSYFKDIYTSNIKKLKSFGVPQDREDNIRQGALIFAMLLEYFGAKLVVTSGVGVREGVFLADLLRNQHYCFPPHFNPSFRSLLDRFGVNKKLQCVVKKNVCKLFEILESKHKIDRKYLFHLKNAAGLTKIGEYVSCYSAHEHSAYLVLNELKYGYSHADQAIIYLLVKYSSKKIPKDDEIVHISVIMPDILTLQWLSFMLSIAETLSLSNKICNVHYDNNILYINSNIHLIKEKIQSLHKPEPIDIEFIDDENIKN